MTDQAVAELARHLRTRAACDAVGASQASYYRRHRHSPTPERPEPVAHRERHQPRALSSAERKAILDVLHSNRFVDVAPAEVWATLLDEGVYLGSQSTFYPIASQTLKRDCDGQTTELDKQACIWRYERGERSSSYGPRRRFAASCAPRVPRPLTAALQSLGGLSVDVC